MPPSKVLITSGPTREPIDDVRYVSNVSSGRLGVAVARAFARAGHDVTLLRGAGSAAPEGAEGIVAVEFTTARSLLDELSCRAATADLLVHAAAVADFAPESRSGKIPSTQSEVVLRLHRTPKVVDAVRERYPRLPIVLFKLEAGILRDELHRRARAAAERVGAIAVVANLVAEVGDASHRADLLRDGHCESLAGRDAIAAALVALEEERREHGRRGSDRAP